MMVQGMIGRQLNKIKLREGMEMYYNVDEVVYNMNFFSFRMYLNTTDDPFFPTRGTLLDINYKYSYNSKINKTDTTVFLSDLSPDNSTSFFSLLFFSDDIIYLLHFLIKELD